MRLTEAEYQAMCQRNTPAIVKRATRRPSKATNTLVRHCELLGVPLPTLELMFHPTRRWKFDAAWPEQKVALEIDGGVFVPGGGRHNRGAGYRADCEKLAEAAILGWRVIRVLPEHVENGVAVAWVQRAFDTPG